MWNLLSKEIRDAADTDEFKKSLKSFLLIRVDEFLTWIDMRQVMTIHWDSSDSPSSAPLPLLGVTY